VSFNDRWKSEIPDYALSRQQTIAREELKTYTQAFRDFGRWILQLQEIKRGTAPRRKPKTWCPTPNKVAYKTFDEAIKGWITARNFFGSDQKAYKCRCGKFHNATVKR
jgi:hypothetical protein